MSHYENLRRTLDLDAVAHDVVPPTFRGVVFFLECPGDELPPQEQEQEPEHQASGLVRMVRRLGGPR